MRKRASKFASMEAGIVHDCHAASSVVVSFMAETGDHNGDAEDFVDVTLVHHASAELLLEDDLPFLSLLCDVGVALCWTKKKKLLLELSYEENSSCAEVGYGWRC